MEIGFIASKLEEAIKKEVANRQATSVMRNVLNDLERTSGIYGSKQFAERTRFSEEQYRKIASGLADKPTLGFLISLCLGYDLTYQHSLLLLERCGVTLNNKECKLHYIYDCLLQELTKYNESDDFYHKIDCANMILMEFGYQKLNPKEKITTCDWMKKVQ